MGCSSKSDDEEKKSLVDAGAAGAGTQQAAAPTPTSKPEEKAAPEKAPEPKVKPTAKPTATSVPAKPTAVPKPTVVPTATPTVPPTTVPTVTPTPPPTIVPTPLSDVFEVHGFTLSLDPNSSFTASGLDVSGLTETEADESQGILRLNYNGADVIFYWQPSGSDAEAQVEAALALLSASQPTRTFTVISQGEISPDGQDGIYSGFLSTADAKGAGGGLIGAWQCGNTAFTMTVSGPDATVIQIRFDRLVEKFECG
tara:strand:- start:257 stop:1021 length:765 start_codon:yes stop_codon:yes gene_type:complete